MSERQQRIQLEEEVQGYQDELRDSYSTIVELRYGVTCWFVNFIFIFFVGQKIGD